MVDVDYVCVVDEIGNPAKIVSNAVRMTKDVRELKMAAYCTRLIELSPFFKDGFSFRPARRRLPAVNIHAAAHHGGENIHMSFAIGGITKPMCDLLDAGLVRNIVDAQAFDIGAIESIRSNPRHFEISTSEYANPLNKGAFVNKLDFVVLAALEVDTDFNVNVLTGSDGVLRGAPADTRTRRRAASAASSSPPDPRPDGHRVRARGHRHHPRRLRGCAGH